MYLMNGKKIKDTGFQAGDIQYPPNWIALATEEERASLGIVWAPDPVRPDSRLGDVAENEDGTYTLLPWPVSVLIETACNLIDDTVSNVYGKWTRFQKEYDLRLTAAQEYIQAGYSGPTSSYIESVATASGISLPEAADLVVQQANMFNSALEQLAAARMRKFEIKRATEPTEVLALQDAIMSQVITIANQLS